MKKLLIAMLTSLALVTVAAPSYAASGKPTVTKVKKAKPAKAAKKPKAAKPKAKATVK